MRLVLANPKGLKIRCVKPTAFVQINIITKIMPRPHTIEAKNKMQLLRKAIIPISVSAYVQGSYFTTKNFVETAQNKGYVNFFL